jgi:serine/threonine-protein kinase
VEIQALLRHRLRILALIAFGGNAFFNAFRFLRLEFTPAVVWLTMVPAAVYLGVFLVLIAALWSARPYTLRQLRWLEGLIFGVTTVYDAWETYTTLFLVQRWLLEYAQRHQSEMSILARQPSTLWMAVIVAYGTFIPNTGRRCAVVTGSIALTPITVVAVAGLLSEVPTRLLVIFLSDMVLWLGVAVAMAIYGSHKITVLRDEAMAARKLGQYQLKQRLGEGGMGEVYLAEHVLLKRPCAVKVIRPDQAGDPTTLQRFLREVQATATLTHPNTVQVFDYGQASDGTVFYAMEYLTGLSLEELVRVRGPLPPARVIFVLRQLCGALAEAHAIGLIHRDIKPSNVVLCNRGGMYDVAKLLDFGLVRMESTAASGAGLTQAGLIFGTPTYMSPEQAAGRDLDARSDITASARWPTSSRRDDRRSCTTASCKSWRLTSTNWPRRFAVAAPTCPRTWRRSCCVVSPRIQTRGSPMWSASSRRCVPAARRLTGPSQRQPPGGIRSRRVRRWMAPGSLNLSDDPVSSKAPRIPASVFRTNGR